MKFNKVIDEALNRRWHDMDSDPNYKPSAYTRMKQREEKGWEKNEKPAIVEDYIERLLELKQFQNYPIDILRTDVTKMVKRYKNSKNQFVPVQFSKVKNGLLPYANMYKRK